MSILVPVFVAIALWWGFTIATLYRTGLPESSFPRTLSMASVLAFAGLVLIARTTHLDTVSAAYAAFTGTLLVWAWHEVSYLLGFVTGPRPEACPETCSRTERFKRGVQASLYHELAIIATGGLVLALTFGAINRVAFWTYCILWGMRWSAKLNIFLGVRNLHLDFLPARSQYLSTFVTRASMNPLFPVSMGLGALALGLCIAMAADAATLFVSTGAVLCATLLSLAMLEHLFLMIDVSDRALWRLGLRSRQPDTDRAGAE
ncbi:MAG: putative photosynthetic complex assembly protein PuhE [Pseudomonadota bacterium]